MIRRFAGPIACAAMLLVSATAARAQATDHLSRTQVRPLDGVNLFLAPHATTMLRGLQLGGQIELARGRSSAWSGAGSVAWETSAGLRLTATARRGSASARETDRTDRSFSLALDGRRAGFSAAIYTVNNSVGQSIGELRGMEVRAWSEIADLFEVGLSMRRATVAEQGQAIDQRRYVVAGYEFTATNHRNFLYVADRRDLEAEISAAIGGLRVTAVMGRALADQFAPARTWAWGRVTVPLPHGLEMLAEAGRNQDGGMVTRPPGGFARFGLRVGMGGARSGRPRGAHPAHQPVAAASAVIDASDGARRLLIESPGADEVEVMGDFTAWQPRTMIRLPDGRWTVPLSAGVLRFNIRIDGGTWTVPAGVSVVADEFSGAPVAVIVVR